MPSEGRMTVDERRKYLQVVAPRYAKAKRPERSGLLTEMAAVTGLHRKCLLRLLHGPALRRVPKGPGCGAGRMERRWPMWCEWFGRVWTTSAPNA